MGYSKSNMNHMNVQTHGSHFALSQYFPNHRRREHTQHVRVYSPSSSPSPPGFTALAPQRADSWELIISVKRGQGLAQPFLLNQPQTCSGVSALVGVKDPVGHLLSGPEGQF